MHFALGHHQLTVIMLISLIGALSPAAQAFAAPVAQQDAMEPMTGAVDPTELAWESAAFTVDVEDGLGTAIQVPGATQGPVTRIERAPSPSSQTTQTKLASQNPAAKQPSVSPEPDLTAEIRSTVKESIRPLHDQWVESGAQDAWSDLKTDLGLSKNKWDSEGATDVDPTMPGRLDAPHPASWQDPANRPGNAAQAEIDRELAATMLKKLIDEIKPWVFSLGGLYLLGYLINAGYGYSKRKSIRRRKRVTARAKRQSARKARSAQPDTQTPDPGHRDQAPIHRRRLKRYY